MQENASALHLVLSGDSALFAIVRLSLAKPSKICGWSIVMNSPP
jgi:hypothetical protein